MEPSSSTTRASGQHARPRPPASATLASVHGLPRGARTTRAAARAGARRRGRAGRAPARRARAGRGGSCPPRRRAPRRAARRRPCRRGPARSRIAWRRSALNMDGCTFLHGHACYCTVCAVRRQRAASFCALALGRDLDHVPGELQPLASPARPTPSGRPPTSAARARPSAGTRGGCGARTRRTTAARARRRSSSGRRRRSAACRRSGRRS